MFYCKPLIVLCGTILENVPIIFVLFCHTIISLSQLKQGRLLQLLSVMPCDPSAPFSCISLSTGSLLSITFISKCKPLAIRSLLDIKCLYPFMSFAQYFVVVCPHRPPCRGPNPSKVLQQLLMLQPEQQLSIFHTLQSHLRERNILPPAGIQAE